MPEILLLCLLVTFWLPAPLRWFILAGQFIFFALAMLDVIVPEGSFFKRLTTPIRAFVVLLTAALFAVSIFFTTPDKLWKRTHVRPPQYGPPAS
jgi:glucan phosphoethanolaminetransferase (alkaline phosphatase superfamily)